MNALFFHFRATVVIQACRNLPAFGDPSSLDSLIFKLHIAKGQN